MNVFYVHMVRHELLFFLYRVTASICLSSHGAGTHLQQNEKLNENALRLWNHNRVLVFSFIKKMKVISTILKRALWNRGYVNSDHIQASDFSSFFLITEFSQKLVEPQLNSGLPHTLARGWQLSYHENPPMSSWFVDTKTGHQPFAAERAVGLRMPPRMEVKQSSQLNRKSTWLN